MNGPRPSPVQGPMLLRSSGVAVAQKSPDQPSGVAPTEASLDRMPCRLGHRWRRRVDAGGESVMTGVPSGPGRDASGIEGPDHGPNRRFRPRDGGRSRSRLTTHGRAVEFEVHLGIGVTVAQLILVQSVQVRILDPQFSTRSTHEGPARDLLAFCPARSDARLVTGPGTGPAAPMDSARDRRRRSARTRPRDRPRRPEGSKARSRRGRARTRTPGR